MSKLSMQAALANSYLSGGNANYLEELYEQFLQDPASVSQEWQNYFKNLPTVGNNTNGDISHAQVRQHFLEHAQQAQKRQVVSGDAQQEIKQAAVDRLIQAYRTYGHFIAKINPLESNNRPHPPQLNLTFYPELTSADQDVQFNGGALTNGSRQTLRQIIATLNDIYCGSVGSEYMYISNVEEMRWMQQQLEQKRVALSSEQKREILQQLTEADGFERYLGHKYVGQKRFGLEGGDAFIPLIHAINEAATTQSIKEVLIAMAHRGRLNVLVNIFGKPPKELFAEFEGRKDYGLTSADVKYHLGYASDIETKHNDLHLTLAFNPSHLEIVAPVLMGSVRARQQRRVPENRYEVMGVIVHGDASVAGQGVVQETLSMSQTRGYQIQGSLHLVINNQVGFTTSDPRDARSSTYCTDVAKMIEAPVLHVNGDDPEAVVFAGRLAVEYRKKFRKDIFIDLVCYRRNGHNEGDEPAATQPVMYNFIRQHPSPRELYAQKLISEHVCTQAEVDAMVDGYREKLDLGESVVETKPDGLSRKYAGDWAPYFHQHWNAPANTAVAKDKLLAIGKTIAQLPEGFEVQRQVSHMLAARIKMTEGELPLDWGYAETMAYATLLAEGYPIRITGEDVRRGTFAHRHAVLHDQKNGATYTPLEHVDPKQPVFQIYDSLLSEAGTMGFDYGYASTDPQTLTIWEAQYGDFVNCAQVVIDQFISSAWQKWGTLCGLVLLLPHGYEGSGPEHTSARPERFLQLCAQDNMQVCMPTTPAQIFHLLRRQVIRPYRVPLIVMTPKSMLRNKLAVSTLDELSHGGFQLVIPETEDIPVAKVDRVVLCSGKVYYDLLVQRRERKLQNIVLIRVEQLYPFPQEEVKNLLKEYKKVQNIVWCQEEPENQGAWYTLRSRLEACLANGQSLHYVGRAASASPAAGYMKLHVKEQDELVEKALGDNAALVAKNTVNLSV